MGNKLFGRLFDGKSIQALHVTIEVQANGLAISYVHHETQMVIVWPLASLEVTEIPHHSRPGIISSKEMVGARLVIQDPAGFNIILPLIPKKQIKLAGFHHPWKVVIWLTIIFVVILIGALWGTQLAAPILARAIPKEWDNKLGEWTIQSVADDHLECVSPQGRQALNKITARLVHSVEGSKLFKVKILEWGEANAFAVPGHHIVIMSGLLHLADSPEEVAGVLAHEMGHAIEHHPTQSIFRQLGFKILITAALGSTYDLASNLLILKYSREDEQKADQIGQKLLEENRINPQGMIDFLTKIAKIQNQWSLKNYWLDYLSSHPDTNERIKALQSSASKVPSQPLLTQPEWRALKNICKETRPLHFEDKN